MKAIWIVLISFLLTAIVVGGGTYYYLNSKATKETNDLNTQISDLQKQVSDLKTASSAESTATASATASWKTYTNTNFGFSTKYPSNLSVTESSPGENDLQVVFTSDPSLPSVLTVSAQPTAGRTLDDLIAVKEKDTSIKAAQKILLAGQPAYEGIDEGMLSEYGLYSVKGYTWFALAFNTNNEEDLAGLKNGLSDTQKGMITTFQFTK